jgi:hypothetical protein
LYRVRDTSLVTLLYMWIYSFPGTIVFYPMYAFITFVKNQVIIAVGAFFWVFYSISLTYVLVPLLWSFCYLYLLLLWSGSVIILAFFFLIRTALTILGLLCLHMNSGIDFFSCFCEECHWNFDEYFI